MRRIYRRKKEIKKTKEFRVNEKIFAFELMVIDENGEQIGVLKKDEAIAKAKEAGLDLVEVSPKAKPPIGKIMDYGSFKYKKEKHERKAKAKAKTVEVKTVKISNRISDHDMAVRAKQAHKFLSGGDKVKVELQLRGREHQHIDLAKENIAKFITEVSNMLEDKEIKTEQEIKKAGSRLSTIISIK